MAVIGSLFILFWEKKREKGGKIGQFTCIYRRCQTFFLSFGAYMCVRIHFSSDFIKVS